MLCFTEDAHAFYLLQALHGVLCQLMFVSRNLIHTDSGNVIQCLGQSGRTDVVRCTSFELERKFVERSLLERYALNHLSPTLVRRQLVEPFFLTIKHTYAGRAINLVTAECEEVGIEVLHIHLHVRHTLRSIDQHRHSVSMSFSNHFLHRIDRTKHIADVHHTNQLGLF